MLTFCGSLVFSFLLCINNITCSSCNNSLGMTDGRIKNSQIDARGGASGYKPQGARLNHGPGWCNDLMSSGTQPYIDPNVYLQIDLLRIHKVTGLSLTGGSGQAQGYSPGTLMQLSYRINAKDNYTFTEKYSVFGIKAPQIHYIRFSTPIHARYLRYHPENDKNHKCIQLELHGCVLIDSKCRSPVLSDNMKYTASSNHLNLHPSYISQTKSSFPWAPSNTGQEFVEVELQTDYVLTGIRTFQPFYITTKLQQPDSFALHYKFGSSKMFLPYTDKTNKEVQFNTEKTLAASINIDPSIAAGTVKIIPTIKQGKRGYLKLQLYGCKLSDPSIFQRTIITTSMVPSTSIRITTGTKSIVKSKTTDTDKKTNAPKAAIKSYEIRQGHKFRDVKYVGKSSKEILHDGKGVLVDNELSFDSPMKKPELWVGWKESMLPRPFVVIILERSAVLNSISLVTYTDRSESLGIFSSCSIQFSSNDTAPWSKGRFACPAQRTTVGGLTLKIDLEGKSAKRLRMQFNYSSEFLVFSEVILNSGETRTAEFLKLEEKPCRMLHLAVQHTSKGSNSGLIIGIVVAIVIILIVVLAFIAYKCRKRIWRVSRSHRSKKNVPENINGNSIENRQLLQNFTKNPTYEVSFKNLSGQSDNTYAEVRDDNASNERELFLKRSENENIDVKEVDETSNIYAAPDQDGVGYIEVTVDPKDGTKNYAEPDSPTDNDNVDLNPIYEAGRIYEDPYQTVTGSSLYADPDSEVDKKSMEIRKFPREKLKFLEKIGTGQFGEVHICEVESLGDIVGSYAGNCSWVMSSTIKVAVKLLKAGVDKNIEKEFMKEVRVMARLQHENVVQLLGICEEEPKCMVVEYMENGDLNQFLHGYSLCKEPCHLDDLPSNMLNEETMLYMCMQISIGMNYLSSQGFIHRDLATRNCLVGHSFTVKISDFGMSRYLYSKQYYRIEGRAVLPIRWMAPESLFYGTFTSQTDVWAFGVTIWEMFTFARETPYNHLNDQQVIDNACSVVAKQRRSFRCLPQPDGCSNEVYRIILRCWERSPNDRPSFSEISKFFQSLVTSTEASV